MTINVTSDGETTRNYFIYCISHWRFVRIDSRDWWGEIHFVLASAPENAQNEKRDEKRRTWNEREIIYKIDMLHHVPWILMLSSLYAHFSLPEILELFTAIISRFPSNVNLFFCALRSFPSPMWCDFRIINGTMQLESDDSLKTLMKFKSAFEVIDESQSYALRYFNEICVRTFCFMI